MISLSQVIHNLIIKLFINKQPTKTNLFNQTQIIKEVQKNKDNLQLDYLLVDMINLSQVIHNLIIKLFINKQLTKTNLFKQIQIIKKNNI